MRAKGRLVRRLLGVGLIFSALFLSLSALAQADVYQSIPLEDTALTPTSVAFAENELFVLGNGGNGGAVEKFSPISGYGLTTTLPFGILIAPRSIAVDGNGAVYVLVGGATGEPQVLKLESGASAPTVLPFGTLSPSVSQIAVDSNGNVFVADDAASRVIELAAGASAPTTLAIPGLQGASAIAVRDSTLLISDENARELVSYDLTSKTKTTVALPAGAFPGALAFGRFGELFVFDRAHTAIDEIFSGTTRVLKVSPEFSEATSLAPVGEAQAASVYMTIAGFPFPSLHQYVTTSDPAPRIDTPLYDDDHKAVMAPIAVNDPNNLTIPITYTPNDEPVAGDFLGFKVQSSNPAVLPASRVSITRSGISSQYTISLHPLTSGPAKVTIIAPESTEGAAQSVLGTLPIEVGVAPEPINATTRYLLGSANASSALAVGDGYFLDADDDDPELRLYREGTTGYPLKSWEPAGIADNNDFEALARHGDDVYEADSFSRGPGRSALIDFGISGSGASTEITTKDVYYGLEQDLIDWDNGRGAPLGIEVSSQEDQKDEGGVGLALEGLEFAPDGTTAYLAFRVPLEPVDGTGARTEALIVPVTNFTQLFGGDPAVHAQFGAPILMHLDGLGIREIRKNAHNQYLLLTGGPGDSPSGEAGPQALWSWDGVATDAPRKLHEDLVTNEVRFGGSSAWESIVEVPDPLTQRAPVTLIQDDGKATPFGQTQKGVAENLQRELTDVFALDLGLPEELTAPAVSGVAAVGSPLSCEPGTWTTGPSFAFTWLRDGAPIASGASYTPVAGDVGHGLACEVTATNAEGSETAVSAAVQPLPAGPAGASGATGSSGPAGASGPGGATGAEGARGPRGARGARGADGKDAAVSCKVDKAKHGPHVTCTVRYAKGGSAHGRALRLVRDGRTVATGRGTILGAAGLPPKGDYTLAVGHGRSVARLAVVVG